MNEKKNNYYNVKVKILFYKSDCLKVDKMI